MTRTTLSELLADRSVCAYMPGQIIYNTGDEAGDIYYLIAGVVKLSAISEDGKEIILDLYHAGEIFGESCLCDKNRNETALALETSQILTVTPQLLFELLQINELALDFIVSIVQRLTRTQETIRELSFDNLSARLVKVLLRLAISLVERPSVGQN